MTADGVSPSKKSVSTVSTVTVAFLELRSQDNNKRLKAATGKKALIFMRTWFQGHKLQIIEKRIK
jgi:hypothetical protein